jgi:hypothetical protein
VLKTGVDGAKAAVSSLGGGANAVNIVTVEDLDGGLTGGFSSQIRFSSATGDTSAAGTGNALFHAANAYVDGAFGTVAIGKIAEASNCAFDPWGCTGGAAIMAGTGISGLIAAGTQASSVSYKSPLVSGFSGGYQTTISARTNQRQVINLNYANGPVAVQFLRSNNSANTAGNGTSSAAATIATITDVKGSGTSIAASYDLGMANVSLFNAVTKDATSTTTSKINGLSVSAPMGAAYTLLGGYLNNSTQISSKKNKMSVGVNYAMSKRTTLGADMFKSEGVSSTTSVANGTGFVVRMRHTF